MQAIPARSKRMDGNIWYLKRCELFENLTALQAERLERRARLRHFSRRSLVYAPKEAGESVLLLVRGRIKIKDITPYAAGGFKVETVFEHRWALAEAFEFHLALGKERVQERILGLATSLKQELAAIKGLTLHTPKSPALSAGIVCFELAGMTPRDIVAKLGGMGIVASTTPYAVSYARLTPGLLNLESDLSKTVDAVKSIT